MSNSSSWHSGPTTQPSLPEAADSLKKKPSGSAQSTSSLALYKWTAQETLEEWTIEAIEQSPVFQDFASSPDVGSGDIIDGVPPFEMSGAVGDTVKILKLCRNLQNRDELDGKLLKKGSEIMIKSRKLRQSGLKFEFNNSSDRGYFTLHLANGPKHESLTYTSHPPDQFLEVIATQGESSFLFRRAGNALNMTLLIEGRETGEKPLYRLYSQQANLQITYELRNGPDGEPDTEPDAPDTALETEWELTDPPTGACSGSASPKRGRTLH